MEFSFKKHKLEIRHQISNIFIKNAKCDLRQKLIMFRTVIADDKKTSISVDEIKTKKSNRHQLRIKKLISILEKREIRVGHHVDVRCSN